MDIEAKLLKESEVPAKTIVLTRKGKVGPEAGVPGRRRSPIAEAGAQPWNRILGLLGDGPLAASAPRDDRVAARSGTSPRDWMCRALGLAFRETAHGQAVRGSAEG